MPVETLFETFMEDSGYNEELWSVEQVRSPQSVPHPRVAACRLMSDPRALQMLRTVVRFGLLQRVFPIYVAEWAACFFGLVVPSISLNTSRRLSMTWLPVSCAADRSARPHWPVPHA